MKNLFLGMAIAATFLTTSARAETINCTEITTVPFVITAQGIYCLKNDKSSSLANGNIIDIQTNNVTIDLNGFKLGGLGAGAATTATGIHAFGRQNIAIRNGSIRGFLVGVSLEGSTSSSGGLVESLLLDGNRSTGIVVQGTGHVVRNNRVVNTGPGAASEADGILVSSARNTLVTDNVVTGTSETSFAIGILVANSSLIEVRGNSILETKDATTKRGVEVSGSTSVTVINNRVLNLPTAPGTAGIIDSGSTTGLGCIDNTVTGYTTALSGCDLLAGNNTF